MKGLTRVVLRLGRNPDEGYPDGDDHFGYVLQAPLDKDGFLDQDLWRAKRAEATVRRFHTHEPPATGWIRCRGENWYFWYDQEEEGPDEPVYKLAAHRLVPGEYVTIREADGTQLTFRVAEVQPI
jgi:hypothetical protein